jgi:holliday junction resolvase Hjr
MSRKSIGINAERELVHLFWERGWTAVRVAGSGSIKYPVPDILAGRQSKWLAIECKKNSNDQQYISVEEVEDLKMFCVLSGADPWIGVRFNHENWCFLRLDELQSSGKSFVITRRFAVEVGRSFDRLIETFNNV